MRALIARRGVRVALAATMLATTACNWGDTAVPESAEMELRPTFGQGAPSLISSPTMTPPPSMRCRFVADTGRIECDSIVREGLPYRASFQFLDRTRRPMTRFDSTATDVSIERSTIQGTRSRSVGSSASIDSLQTTSEMTRRGLLSEEQILSGISSIRSRSVSVSGRDTATTMIDGRTEWRDLHFPRRAVTFNPDPSALSRPGLPVESMDSLVALLSATGPWATRGERIEEMRFSVTDVPSAFTRRGSLTYLSGDRALVVREVGGARPIRCLVDRPTASARCD
ncbi:MAG: hypothetical protein MUF00_10215 [Gemmatimonadaceae bacterium]|jgi:hypothetical protein|nr:hypothetical protein [Gemmatimonadaceae bacterium]